MESKNDFMVQKSYVLAFALIEASIIQVNRIKDPSMKKAAKYWIKNLVNAGKNLRYEYLKSAQLVDKDNGQIDVNGDAMGASDIYDYFGLLIADSSSLVYDICDYDSVISLLKNKLNENNTRTDCE